MAEAGQGAGNGKKRRRRKGSGAGSTGRVRLQKAVQKEMGKNSGRLAKALMEKALTGDVSTTKMLWMLADPKTTKGEAVEREEFGPTPAELLAKERSWDDTPPEEQRRILIEQGRLEEYLEDMKWSGRGPV